MAKVMVPIIKLRYGRTDAVSSDVLEIFEAAGVWNPEEDYTFTGRVTVQSETLRDQLRERIMNWPHRYGKAVRLKLLALLDEHDWDISFLVDCF